MQRDADDCPCWLPDRPAATSGPASVDPKPANIKAYA
ncbi:MAG: hypothetical protein QOG05_4065, partial [Streptosporangiaceae bacterium]|nr:hypothetical protein [Streptosporangiaceae bacterium]